MQLTKPQPGDWFSRPQSCLQPYVKSCSCFNTHQSSYLPLYAFQVFFEKHIEHGNGCPYIYSAVSWAVGIRTLRPKLEFVVKLQLGKNFVSIDSSLSLHNIVDRSKSPAFVPIEKARQNLVFLATADHERPWFKSYEPEIGTPQRRIYGEIVRGGGISSTRSGYTEFLVCIQADQRYKRIRDLSLTCALLPSCCANGCPELSQPGRLLHVIRTSTVTRFYM